MTRSREVPINSPRVCPWARIYRTRSRTPLRLFTITHGWFSGSWLFSRLTNGTRCSARNRARQLIVESVQVSDWFSSSIDWRARVVASLPLPDGALVLFKEVKSADRSKILFDSGGSSQCWRFQDRTFNKIYVAQVGDRPSIWAMQIRSMAGPCCL